MSTTPSSSELCVLCLEPKTEPEILNCGHSFCHACLDDLKSYRSRQWARCCPLCRQPIGVEDNNDDDDLSTIYDGSVTSDDQWEGNDTDSTSDFSVAYYDFDDQSYYYYTDYDTSTEDGQSVEFDQDDSDSSTENDQSDQSSGDEA